jgi:hypothetical protein
MQIQARNRFRRSKQHRQLELCVPLVILTGDSYRTRARRELLVKGRAGTS